MMFGQLSNGGRATSPLVWHVLRPAEEGWTTVCTASTARPGLTVVNLSSEPGPTVCKLKRCRVVADAWMDSRTLV
jgi:hypothetical protein